MTYGKHLRELIDQELDHVSGGDNKFHNVTAGNGNTVPGGGNGLITENNGGNAPPGQNK